LRSSPESAGSIALVGFGFDSLIEVTSGASLPGIIFARVSLVVMSLLARAKRKVARGIRSSVLMADSKQTELCTYLSAICWAGCC